MDESVSNGIKFELVPLSKEYKEGGGLPEFDAVITNISGKDINFCTYYLKYRLLNTLMGGEYETFYFGTTPQVGLKASDFMILKPAQKIIERLSVEKEANFQMLPAASLPPYFDEKMGVKGLAAGEYTFQAYLSNWVLFFGAPEGQHNFTRKDLDIKKDIPFAEEGLERLAETAWDGACTAKCSVRVV